MLGRTLGFVATAAMGANALLLPFGAKFESDLPVIGASSIDGRSQLVRMPCGSCVFSSKAQNAASIASEDEEPTFHAQGGAIDLIFNVTIAAQNQLFVNGDLVDRWHPPQNVIQVPASASTEEIATMQTKMELLRITGIAASTVAGDGMVTQHKFTITSLDGHPVYLDDLEIDILILGSGGHMLIGAYFIPSSSGEEALFAEIRLNEAKKAEYDAAHPKPPPTDCSAAGPFHRAFCEIQSQIAKFRTSHFKKPGCKGKGKNSLFRGHAAGGKPPGGMVIGVLPGHIKHRPNHHHSRPPVGGYIASAAFILGVWIASFFVGMMLAKVILFVTACVRRVFFGVPVRREVVVVKEEGQALMAEDVEEEEAPPVYEDAPVYEEKQ